MKIMESINKENTLENILKEFSAQKPLLDNLGDALMHISTEGYYNEKGEWEEPEWKSSVLFNLGMARSLIQKLYLWSLEQSGEKSN